MKHQLVLCIDFPVIDKQGEEYINARIRLHVVLKLHGSTVPFRRAHQHPSKSDRDFNLPQLQIGRVLFGVPLGRILGIRGTAQLTARIEPPKQRGFFVTAALREVNFTNCGRTQVLLDVLELNLDIIVGYHLGDLDAIRVRGTGKAEPRDKVCHHALGNLSSMVMPAGKKKSEEIQ